MAGFADEGLAREHDRDLSPLPADFDAYAHVEGLVGEETRLLEEAEQGRREEHRVRLKEIREELDRAWESLRRRAERPADPGS